MTYMNGSIDLHETPVGINWKRLEATAQADRAQITLESAVTWPNGG